MTTGGINILTHIFVHPGECKFPTVELLALLIFCTNEQDQHHSRRVAGKEENPGYMGLEVGSGLLGDLVGVASHICHQSVQLEGLVSVPIREAGYQLAVGSGQPWTWKWPLN